LRALFIVTDSYGTNGGIGKYIRDFILVTLETLNIDKINLLSRNIIVNNYNILPKNINLIHNASKGKLFYIYELIKNIFVKHDLIICGHINLLPLAFIATFFHKCPIILIVYGIEVWEKPKFSFIIKKIIDRIDKIVTISKFTQNKMNKWLDTVDDKYYLLPNSIDVNDYGIKHKNLKLIKKHKLENKQIIFTLCRLSEFERYKGIDEVLDILNILLLDFPNLVYIIGGEGIDRIRLEKKVNDLNLTKAVLFVGYINEKEKADFFRLANIYVMPGYGEGFGFVYLEAIACGLRVIASSLDGSIEAVRFGLIGEYVNPNNKQELVNLIIKLLNNKNYQNVIPDGLSYFSIEALQLRFIDLITSIDASLIKNNIYIK